MRLARVALVAVGMAVAVAGCGRAEARMCGTSRGAEFCLVESGRDLKTTGHGFRPDSEVRVVVDDREAPPGPAPLLAGPDGKFPAPGQGSWVNRGPSPQRVRVTGTTPSGAEAVFEFTVPAAPALGRDSGPNGLGAPPGPSARR